ncbi:MAG: acylneuraminate cytidylyltransferase family protein [Deltaproteobacteria bacterium]|nr:acylneuraminate cytidylyltransferase family protein [Deltaproteobacteria bacterium]MBW2018604.1 acylneuraminate cytidylyltransferase family protein [Deltaproteobacteria bacterium]MBW2073870.1 acylneuraminate cytidylyltransferase family protein [Deltaproteobacteria bacterium]
MTPYVMGFVFARGGSKGVPRKNVRLLAGKPLIAYAIETGLESGLINRVIVSTEDPEIAETARKHGAEVPFMRPKELALDDTPEWLAWQHAVRVMKELEPDIPFDVFVAIPPTSPLRSVDDVDNCIKALIHGDTDVVITVREAERSPYFNMVRIDENGMARLVIEPEDKVFRRQDVPPVFDITTVAYAARPDFILRAESIFEGKVKAIHVPVERALDIDTEWDFKVAECILSQAEDRK